MARASRLRLRRDEDSAEQPGYALVGVLHAPQRQASPSAVVWRRIGIALVALIASTVFVYVDRDGYHDVRGGNCRLDGLQAAILDVKLSHLDAWNARRRELATRYTEALRGVGDLVLPVVPEHVVPVWHLYVVQTAQRDALLARLNERGVGASIHYPIPIHQQGAFPELHGLEAELPNATRHAPRLVSLPIFPELTRGQLEEVEREEDHEPEQAEEDHRGEQPLQRPGGHPPAGAAEGEVRADDRLVERVAQVLGAHGRAAQCKDCYTTKQRSDTFLVIYIACMDGLWSYSY